MHDQLKYFFLLLIMLSAQLSFAQYTPGTNNPQLQTSKFGDTSTRSNSKRLSGDQEIDTIRKREEHNRDSVIFTSKFIKVTNEALLKDSTQVFPIDTGIVNFENYSLLYQPNDPKISLGHMGLDARDLLFTPSKTVGFDVGLHTLDIYEINPEDINYYKARVPYTVLTLYTGGLSEQYFKVVHTQNIKPNWNVGFNLNFLGSQGYYATQEITQNVSNINFALFTWYESKNKRYNLLANTTINNLKAPETGSISDEDIFTTSQPLLDKATLAVRLPNTYENWHDNGIYIKQFYYIGRMDSVIRKGSSDSSRVLPTQRVAYTLNYNVRKYEFLQNDNDTAHVFPDYYYSSNRSRDSLTVTHLQNDFSYSFTFRPKNAKVFKNEVKLDVGLTQDIYSYTQFVSDSTINQAGAQVVHADKVQSNSFQDITLKGKLSYQLNDHAAFQADVSQIAAGRDFGDFLYDFKLMLAGGKKAGKIILDAYTQSTTPPLVYTDWISNHYIWHNNFANQKTNSASFTYINQPLQFNLKAEYFLITDYLYFASEPNGIDATPQQLNHDINLLKVTLSKNVAWRRWHFDNMLIYQKTDYQDVLRTPELYTYSSLYYSKLLFGVLNSNIGIDVRYNTPFVAPSYAVGLGEFYNGPNITFASYPKATVFMKATLYRTNLFVMYDYADQGLFQKGYYTVNRYPMEDAQLKFGVSWTFYN
jgi:hypothetical protein